MAKLKFEAILNDKDDDDYDADIPISHYEIMDEQVNMIDQHIGNITGDSGMQELVTFDHDWSLDEIDQIHEQMHLLEGHVVD